MRDTEVGPDLDGESTRFAGSSRRVKVAALVLNWNTPEQTINCAQALLTSTTVPEVIVIDNGSTDDSWERLQSLGRSCTLVQTGKNLGYAGGNNVGIALALALGVDYVWVINNDAVPAKESLAEMLRVIEADPAVGLVVPTILYGSSDRVWYAGGSYNKTRGTVSHHFINARLEDVPGAAVDTGFATGCSLLIRASVLSLVGFLDARFFLYWEDVEFADRVRRAGFRVVHCPSALVWHHVGAASGAADGASPNFYYYGLRNRLWYLRSCREDGQEAKSVRVTAGVLVDSARNIVRREHESRLKKLGAALRGTLAGWLCAVPSAETGARRSQVVLLPTDSGTVVE